MRSFQDTLFGLKTCYALSRHDLDANPVCPHTGYRPVETPRESISASQILANLDDRLDNLLNDWTQTLLTNLDDPTVRANIDLISDQTGKNDLAAFMASRELPDPVSPALVQAFQEALTGLERVAVTDKELRTAPHRRRPALHLGRDPEPLLHLSDQADQGQGQGQSSGGGGTRDV